jgi:dihydrodipicolinate synthase/N-acetylneuraminate lyase
LAGSADFFLPALSVGAVGCVPGLANVMPRSCVELLKLYQKGDYKAATELQVKLVLPDDALARWFGLPGVKAGLEHFAGYGGPCRLPLRAVTQEQKDKIIQAVTPAFAIEQSLKN